MRIKAQLSIAALVIITPVLAMAGCSSGGQFAVAQLPTATVQSTPGHSADRDVSPIRGAELYAASCQQCHGDREGIGGTGAPTHNGTDHTWHHPDAQLKDWVINGKTGFGQMPGFEGTLMESDVEAILAHIRSWWTPEQRSSQADLSRRYQEALDKQNKER